MWLLKRLDILSTIMTAISKKTRYFFTNNENIPTMKEKRKEDGACVRVCVGGGGGEGRGDQ